jgi:hypothetical protein
MEKHCLSLHLPFRCDLSAFMKNGFKKSTTKMTHSSSVAIPTQTSIRMLFVVVSDALSFVWLL